MPFVELVLESSAVIFNFNGTLSNDEAVLEKAYDNALRKLKLEPLKEGEYEALLGLSDRDISRMLTEARSAEHRVEELLEALTASYLEQSRGNELIGTKTVSMIQALQSRDIRVGIVTGTFRKLIEPVLFESNLSALIPFAVTIEDVKRGKPDPEGFLLGAKVLGVDPKSVLVFEDSAAGIASAHSAGMAAVAVGPKSKGMELCDYSFDAMENAAEVVLRGI